MIRVSGESKSRLVKAAGAEACGQRRNEKLHAAVVRSAFVSENVQNTAAPDHFSKFRCRKNCKKTDGPGALFEVLLSKNCMRLWREAHLQVKMLKN